MHSGKRYRFRDTLYWTRKYIIIFLLWGTVPVILHMVGLEWMHLPWQPISVIGIAVAFYLGFKNNSSYDRLWEARKIWGGIVNASRSFAVMARDFVNNDEAESLKSKEELQSIRTQLIHRHVAWLHAFALQLRQIKPWEHQKPHHWKSRQALDTEYSEEKMEGILNTFLPKQEVEYLLTKGNRASHLLSSQSKSIMQLRREGTIEHFRHLQMQSMITEFYTLQGKAERIKNFPFPRQYASINLFFVVIFIFLIPFGMLDIFHDIDNHAWIWVSIPFSAITSWVFWMMEIIGDFSENPFEGLHNDVPITSMARGIEIDIRQMIDETDIPDPVPVNEAFNVKV